MGYHYLSVLLLLPVLSVSRDASDAIRVCWGGRGWTTGSPNDRPSRHCLSLRKLQLIGITLFSTEHRCLIAKVTAKKSRTVVQDFGFWGSFWIILTSAAIRRCVNGEEDILQLSYRNAISSLIFSTVLPSHLPFWTLVSHQELSSPIRNSRLPSTSRNNLRMFFYYSGVDHSKTIRANW